MSFSRLREKVPNVAAGRDQWMFGRLAVGAASAAISRAMIRG